MLERRRQTSSSIVLRRVVSPEISSEKFPEIYSYFYGNFRKIAERFYRELFTTTNLPNNCAFAYNDAFERLLQHLWTIIT